VSRISPSSLLALAAALVLSCGGSTSAPKRAATPASGGTAGGLQPLSSQSAPEAGTPPSLPPGHPPLTAAHGGAAAASSGHVAGTIALAPRLEKRLSPTDVLYVIAKKDGATLAVQRIESPRFPLAFELSAANAMMAGAAFEGPVDVTARLSKTGDAIATSGDLEGTKSGVPVPADGISITIDKVRP
jgi:cytochrome c-type biogenesis protein CcmH